MIAAIRVVIDLRALAVFGLALLFGTRYSDVSVRSLASDPNSSLHRADPTPARPNELHKCFVDCRV